MVCWLAAARRLGWTVAVGGLLLAGVLAPCARAADPVNQVKLPEREQVHLYLLIGQSNMAGRGEMKDEDRVPRERIVMLNAQDAWVPAAHPLHFDKTIAGVGLGLPFAEAMAKAQQGVTIGLIPCAVGGTPLSRWSKGGDLYQNAVRRAKAALLHGELKGILWHQGESDSGSDDTANSYAQRLEKMIADLRAELNAPDVPFVAGELGVFFVENSGRPGTQTVNNALKDLPKSVKGTATASAQGLDHKGDKVHFNREGLITFGQRYAEAMLKLQQQNK